MLVGHLIIRLNASITELRFCKGHNNEKNGSLDVPVVCEVEFTCKRCEICNKCEIFQLHKHSVECWIMLEGETKVHPEADYIIRHLLHNPSIQLNVCGAENH